MNEILAIGQSITRLEILDLPYGSYVLTKKDGKIHSRLRLAGYCDKETLIGRLVLGAYDECYFIGYSDAVDNDRVETIIKNVKEIARLRVALTEAKAQVKKDVLALIGPIDINRRDKRTIKIINEIFTNLRSAIEAL